MTLYGTPTLMRSKGGWTNRLIVLTGCNHRCLNTCCFGYWFLVLQGTYSFLAKCRLIGTYGGVGLFYATVGRIPKQDDVAIFKAQMGDLPPSLFGRSRKISWPRK
jgi:hypothetical protein